MPSPVTLLSLAITASFTSIDALANNIDWSEQELIQVVGYTPLTNTRNDYGVMKSSLREDELSIVEGSSLARLLDDKLVSVSINDVQNNPFQPDVQYRGFTASPLLGLPQGLSIYLNGTRFNEPFGDTVNWDLLPVSALNSASIVSGANPLFGQNTLGGALTLRSKTGFSFERSQVTLLGGSFGQYGATLETGGNDGKWAGYVNASLYEEDGWRDFSPSEVKQLFGVLSHQTSTSESHLTVALADNDLIGNGAIPVDLIAYEGREAIYTRPDQTLTDLTFVSLQHRQALTDSIELAVNSYFRQNDIATYNGDDSDYEECASDAGVTLCEELDDDDEEAEGDPDDDITDDVGDAEDDDDADAIPVQFTGYLPIVPLSQLTNINADDVDGTANTSQTSNKGYGISAELSGTSNGSVTHHWVVGAGIDKAQTDFRSRTEFAILSNDTAQDTRDVSGIGLFDNASEVFLKTDSQHLHVLFSDTMQLTQTWQLWLSGRYNRSDITMHDQIDSGEGSLNGDHQFSRFNPAIGVEYRQGNHLITLSYSESSRTPSPAELSCADEDDPCKLPNGFVADPPLKQVVTDTLEAGYRWAAADTELAMTVYHSDSTDDIIFQQAGDRPSVGYFVNVDRTRRQGAEFAARHQWQSVTMGLNASWLSATFESPFVSFSPQNPLGPDREVDKGDHIPGQPQRQLGLDLDWQVSASITVSANLNYTGSQYFRGDEANENRQIGGYTLVSLAASWQANDALQLGIRANNLFNKHFETFGTYGEADEVLGDIYDDIESVEFVGVGQPRAVVAFASWQF